MTMIELSFAIVALLITPGPTNTLLMLAGTERGLPGSLRLIPAELLGYLLVVVPLALVGGAVLHDAPHLRAVVAVAAGLWVGWLALKLWRRDTGAERLRAVNAALVLLTTMLNPKALIFGLVLLPSPDQLGRHITLFAALVVLVACGWAGFGAVLAGRGGAMLPWVRRLASVWLGVVALTLLAKGLGA